MTDKIIQTRRPLLARIAAGKPQLLAEHLAGTARRAEAFAARLGLPMTGRLLGLLHDAGKSPSAWQDALARGERPMPHSPLGAAIAFRWGGKGKESPARQMLALCIWGHHAGLPDCQSLAGEEAQFMAAMRNLPLDEVKQCWESLGPELRAEISAAMKAAIPELKSFLADMRKQAITACPAGWRDAEAFACFWQGMLARALLGCLADADRQDAAAFCGGDPEERTAPSLSVLAERLERHLADMTAAAAVKRLPLKTRLLNTIRGFLSDACEEQSAADPGISTCTIPTGGGKTLAAMRWALHHAVKHGLERVVVVAPYTSVVEQTAGVYRNVFEKDAGDAGRIVLEHHCRMDAGEAGASFEAWTAAAADWDVPVVCTTAARLLETLFGGGTGNALRMHRLARAVVVLDEAQRLPERDLAMLCRALRFLAARCGASILLCTATQPGLDALPGILGAESLPVRGELADGIQNLSESFRRVRFSLHCSREHMPEEIADMALAEVRARGACLAVSGTKRSAEAVWRACRKKAPADLPVFFLSSMVCPAHRRMVYGRIRVLLSEGKPCLCVSTQLIECGVDVSFPALVRAEAGLDAIVQAAGRCARNAECEGIVHVVRIREELEMMPDLADARRAFRFVLGSLPGGPDAEDADLLQPELMTAYFFRFHTLAKGRVHHPVSPDDKLAEGVPAGRACTLLGMLSQAGAMHRNGVPMAGQPFRTAARLYRAVDGADETVCVPWGAKGQALCAELEAVRQDCPPHILKRLMRRAAQYAVGVREAALRRMEQAGAVRQTACGVWTVREDWYSADLGLQTEAEGQGRTRTGK